MTDQQEPNTAVEEKQDKWWHTLLWGLFMFAFGAFLYWYFTDFENSTDTSKRMNIIIGTLYTLGGKNLPVGICAALGAVLCAMGIKDFISGRKKGDS